MNSGSTGSVVDSKVVEMSFDNSQFEPNAEKSLSTLDKLKKALNFSGSTDGLDDINTSLKNISVNSLINGVTTLRGAFDSLADTVGFAAVVRYTNQALDAVERLTKSMTVDQIAGGWQKYGEKTTSVATLVAQGYELEKVNDQLERLNWFTDETSYNFTDMVSNIAKFTATGQDLETSVTAMEGIATWAALSGQNATTASHAMYQLSQAMGAGVMRKEDYKSIQNVSMDTDEFRQKALDAAVALGTLKKTGDDTYASLVADSKKGKEEFSKSQFAESLTQGQWFTKDVMMKVFNDYSAAVDQIYEYAEEKGITASEAMAEAGDQFDEFGVKAFKAAQEARTWADVVDSVKDATSTAFMNMFQIIFGDYEQATALWTSMANGLYDLFVEPINGFNEVLGEAFGTADKVVNIDDWSKLGLSRAQAEGLAFALKDVAEANGVAFDPKDLNSFLSSLDSGWLKADKLKEVLEGFTGGTSALEASGKTLDEFHEAVQKVIQGGPNGYSSDMTERFKQLQEDGFDPQQVQDYVNELYKLAGGTWNLTDAMWAEADANLKLTESLASKSDEELLAMGYTQEQIDGLRELAKEAEETKGPLDALFNGEEGESGRDKLLKALRIGLRALSVIATAASDAFHEIFPPITAETITKIIDKVHELTSSFRKFVGRNRNNIKNIFLGIFSAIDLVIRTITTFVGGGLKLLAQGLESVGLLKFLGHIGELIKKFRDWAVENEVIQKAFDSFSGAITSAVAKVKEWIDTFTQIPAVQKVLKAFKTAFNTLFENFGPTLSEAIGSFSKFFGNLWDYFKALTSGEISFSEFIDSVKWAFEQLWKDLGSIDAFKAFGDAFGTLFDAIKAGFTSLFGDFGKSIVKTKNAITKFFGNIWTYFKALTSGEISFSEFIDSIKWAFEQLWKDLGNVDIIKTIGEKFGALKDIIGEKLSGVGDVVMAWFQSFRASLGDSTAGKIFDWIVEKFTWVKDQINELLSGKELGEDGEQGQSLIEKLKGNLSLGGFLEFVGDVISGIFGLVKKIPFGKLVKLAPLILAVVGIVKAVKSVSGIFKAGKGALDSVSSFFDNFRKNGIKGLLQGTGEDDSVSKLERAAKAIRTLAISIGILLAAVYLLTTADQEKLVNAVLVLAIVAAILVAVAGFQMIFDRLDTKNSKAKSTTMIGIAIGIFLMAKALETLSKIEPGRLLQAVLALVAIAAVLTALMFVSKVSNKNLKGKVKFGSMLGIAAAVYIMALALEKLGKIDPDNLAMAELALIMVGAVLAGLMYVAKISGKGKAGNAKFLSMLGIAAAVYILALALAKIATIKPERLKEAEKALVIIAAVLAALMLVSKISAGGLKGGTKFATLIGIAATIYIMALALAKLATIKPERLQQAEEALTLIVVLFAAIMLIDRLSSSMFGGGGSLMSMIGIAAAVLAMATALTMLAGVDPDNLKNATLCMTIMMGMFAALMVVSKFVKGVSPTLLILVGVIAILGVVLAAISLLPADKVLPAAISLSLVILALTAVLGALAIIGPMSAGVDAGIIALAKVAAVFLAFGVVAVALGALVTKFPQLQQFLDTGIELLVGIASGLGRIIGAFLGGIVSDMMAEMPGVADNLKLFLEKMQEASAVGTFDFGPLAEALAAIAAIDIIGFIGSIGSLVNELTEGKSNVQVFADDLVALGTSFATYQTAMDEVDGIEINTAPLMEALGAIAAISLFEFLNTISNLASLLTTKQTAVETFASDLTTLADAFAEYATTMDTIKGITIDTTGLTDIIDIMGEVSLTGLVSALGTLLTDDDKTAVETFSTDLTSLSTAIKEWDTTMEEIGSVEIDSEGIQSVIDAVNAVPKKDLFDAIGAFFGIEDTSFDDFKENSGKLGEAITAFSTSLGDIDDAKLTTAANAAKMIGDLGLSLRKIDLKSGFFSGDTDFGRFGEALVAFGPKLNEFANSVTDADRVGEVAEAAKNVAQAGLKMSMIDLTTGDLMDEAKVQMFSDNIDKLVAAIEKANTAGLASTSGIENLTGATSKLNQMQFGDDEKEANANAGKAAADATAQGIENSASAISGAMSTAMSGALDSINGSSGDYSAAGLSLMTALSVGMLKAAATVRNAAKTVANAGKDEIRNKRDAFKGAGSYVGFGFSSGINSTKSDVEATAGRIAQAAVDKIKATIRSASPSKVTMQLGKYFGQGFVIGIGNYTSKAGEAGSAIGDSARKGLQNAVSALNRIITEDMDATPVVRPVMDLSEIQNGASTISSMLNTAPSLAVAGNMGAISYGVNNRMNPNADLLSAINSLKGDLANNGNTYVIDGITYDDGSNIVSAVETLVHAARKERRI